MSDWVQHDGKGVPKDAIPGVTICEFESFCGEWIATSDYYPGPNGTLIGPWMGEAEIWDWSNWGRPATGEGWWPRILKYRNPRQASTDTGMAMLKEILDRETIEPVSVPGKVGA